MKTFNRITLGKMKLVLVLGAVIFLTACGGGGGGGGSSPGGVNTYVIGGTVSGLAVGQQVTLQNNAANPVTVTANGSFSFSTPVAYNGIRERQREGIAIAKAKGVYKGRKPALTREQQTQLIEAVRAGAKKSDLMRQYGVSRQTLYNYLET